METFRDRHLLLMAIVAPLVLVIGFPLLAAGQGKTPSQVVVVNPAAQPVLIKDLDRPIKHPRVVHVRFQWEGGDPAGPKNITPPMAATGCFVIESVTGEVRVPSASVAPEVNIYMNVYRNSSGQEEWQYGAQFPAISVGTRKQIHQQTKLFVNGDGVLYLGFFGAGGSGEADFTVSGYSVDACSVEVSQF